MFFKLSFVLILKPNSNNITHNFANSIKEELSFEVNAAQNDLSVLLADFVISKSSNAFILKGYAGTGKSSMVAALVKALMKRGIQTVLLAPTGRAAKVISLYSEQNAFTIHKKIYKRQVSSGGMSKFVLMPNIHSRTLFVVDEASMLSDDNLGTGVFSDRSLLNDLIMYVKQGRNCKLLLVGDTAQLPPVGLEISPALNEDVLSRYGMYVHSCELDEVARQKADSGILHNATLLRNKINKDKVIIPQFDTNFEDIRLLSGYDLQEELDTAYGQNGLRNVIVVTRSNKRALEFNQQIRSRIFWHESLLVTGELLMVVKNNYFWSNTKEIGFIANGDLVEVVRIHKYHEKHGFRFAEVTAAFVDYPSKPEIELLVMLDSLEEPHASMPREKLKVLWNNVMLEHDYEKNLGKRKKRAMNDPFMNALVVKYAYAITCHKSQGGQWPIVVIDHGYLTEEMMGNSFLRWMYTAMTRAQERVYLLNFHKSFIQSDFD